MVTCKNIIDSNIYFNMKWKKTQFVKLGFFFFFLVTLLVSLFSPAAFCAEQLRLH